jgi:hypothetical protein
VKAVRLSEEAAEELTDAATWYRDRRPGLEAEFLAEIERLLPLIGRAPAAFPRLLIPAGLGPKGIAAAISLCVDFY